MGSFHVALVDHGVHKRGFDFRVAEQALDLLNGHAFVDGARGQRAPEFVRMNAVESQLAAKVAQACLHAADVQPLVRVG